MEKFQKDDLVQQTTKITNLQRINIFLNQTL